MAINQVVLDQVEVESLTNPLMENKVERITAIGRGSFCPNPVGWVSSPRVGVCLLQWMRGTEEGSEWLAGYHVNKKGQADASSHA